MALDWTTFFLQIINFLVLVWILKRFLYKPVLDAIAQRKAVIDRTLDEANSKERSAETLVQQYQNRIADWENEKEKLRAAVLEELSALRAQKMAALESSLQQERERTSVLEQRRLSELRSRAEEEGQARGVQFTARLLTRVADPELEARLVGVLLEDLGHLPDEQINVLRSVAQQARFQGTVTSAFPLSTQQRSLITQKLHEATAADLAVDFKQDAQLLAGLRISVGAWVLRANLADELEFFTHSLRHG